MKVFIVTSGEYDDYRIDRVFSTKEKAEDRAKWQNRSDSDFDDSRVEEYEVDELIERIFD